MIQVAASSGRLVLTAPFGSIRAIVIGAGAADASFADSVTSFNKWTTLSVR